jgi:hypothetical protein
MKTKLLSLSLLIAGFSINAQDVQKRDVTTFNKIHLSGATDVVYTNSDTLKVEVKTIAKQFDNLITKIENGTLFIYTKGNIYSPIVVNVSSNNLNAIEVSGASSIKSSTPLKKDSLSVTISGSSDAKLILENDYTRITQSGASDLTLIGTTNNLITQISGASTLKSYSLTSKQANVTATGASTAKIFVTDKLVANASGASNIKVKGNVSDISANASTSSSIVKILDDGTKKFSADNNTKDSTFFNWKDKKIIIVDIANGNNDTVKKHHYNMDNDDFKHWQGFSMGVNGYLTFDNSLTMENKYNFMDLNYSRSFNFQLNMFERQFNIYKNYVKINTGFGFDFHLYSFNNKTTLNADSSFTWGTVDSTNTYSYHKNKLRCTYIQVPLILEFNTSNNPDKAFHIGVGVVGQYLITSRTKQTLEQNNNDFTKIRKDNYNLNPFGAKALVNIGYREFTLFAEYSLTSLFKTNQGAQLYPFTVGVRLIPF